MPPREVQLNEASRDDGSSSSSSLDTQHSQSDGSNGNDQSVESMLQRPPAPLMRAPSSSPGKSPSPQVLQRSADDVPIVQALAGSGFELNIVAQTQQHDDQARNVHSGGSTTAPSLNLDKGVHLSLQGLHAPPAPQGIWSTSCSQPVPPSLANRASAPIFGINNLQPTTAFMMGGGGGGGGSGSSCSAYQFYAPNLPHELHLDSFSQAHISSAGRPTSLIALCSQSQLENGIGGHPLCMRPWTNWPPQRAEDAQVQGQWPQINGNYRSDGLPYSFEALLRTGYGGVPSGGNTPNVNLIDASGREFPRGSWKVGDQLALPPPANLQPPPHNWMIQPTANTPRPNTPRSVMNSNYDPAYQAMGLPVDPHLRAFLAKYNNRHRERQFIQARQ